MTGQIERARTILAEVRNGATPGPWEIALSPGRSRIRARGVLVASSVPNVDVSLIVLMTNPALLDAIDGMLQRAAGQYERGYQGGWNDDMERIASAIVTAYEGMQR